MKRILIGAIAVLVFLGSAATGMAQGGYGRRGPGWNQPGPRVMRGQGLRNGTGPRALNGTCPWFNNRVQAPAANVAPPGSGLRNGTGPRALNGNCRWFNARVQGPTANKPASGGWGPRNGAGPRALNGTCPLLSPGTSVPAPNTTVVK